MCRSMFFPSVAWCRSILGTYIHKLSPFDLFASNVKVEKAGPIIRQAVSVGDLESSNLQQTLLLLYSKKLSEVGLDENRSSIDSAFYV